MKAEIVRRQSLADALESFLRARPNVWIAAVEFEPFGRQAWRTRLSEVRQRFEAEGGAIENRQRRVGGAVLSDYRYQPNPLGGRDAATEVPGNIETGTLFDVHPSGWQR